MDIRRREGWISQLHDVIEEILRLVPAYLQDVHEPLVGAGDGLEFLDSREFADVRPIAVELGSLDDLDRPQCPQSVLGLPNHSITPPANLCKQIVIAYDWRKVGRHSATLNPLARLAKPFKFPLFPTFPVLPSPSGAAGSG